MTTGEKIAKCRKKLNLTQEQLAAEMGVTRQAVSRWESDFAFPETDTLVKLSKLFGVSCDWLLNYNSNEQNDGREEKREEGKFLFDIKNLHFEYKSKTRVGKLPLVHVNIGLGRVAKGVFAVGLVSVGIVSVGLLSLGIFAFGTLCLGIISLGSLSAGIISAGAVALGCIALGGVAVGMFSLGGCAVGLFACGGYASGAYVAIGDIAVGGIALGNTRADGSVLSVLKPQYAQMRDTVLQKLKEIPNVWAVFANWCEGLANVFMKN